LRAGALLANGFIMRVRFSTFAVSVVLALVAACSSSGGEDELVADVDASTPRRDSGTTTPVDPPAEVDAGSVQDASVPVVGSDAGTDATVVVDAGAPVVDAGTPVDARAASDATVLADAGADAGAVSVDAGRDSGSTVDAGRDAGIAVDAAGTTAVGATCSASLDCRMAAGLTGICSALSPTPACLATGCAITSTTSVEYCDSDRGVCLSGGSSNYCIQKCAFGNSTSAPTGCTGSNRCNAYGFSRDTGGVVSGVGYCLGVCASNAECPTGFVCQVEDGLCVAPASYVTYTLAVGSACTVGTTTTCNCVGRSGAAGVCTKACVVGRSGTCGAGFTCASDVPKTFSDSSAAFTALPTGLAGNCYKNCTTNAQCPTGSYCDTNDVAGMVCKPNP